MYYNRNTISQKTTRQRNERLQELHSGLTTLDNYQRQHSARGLITPARRYIFTLVVSRLFVLILKTIRIEGLKSLVLSSNCKKESDL